MRFITALLLLVSVLTTHAVALERAAEKALTCTKGVTETVAKPASSDAAVTATLELSVMADLAADPERLAGPCHGHGDCVFLMPQHRLATSMLVPAMADERPCHESIHHGRLVKKPPIA